LFCLAVSRICCKRCPGSLMVRAFMSSFM
jgi:hypothetical protein